MFYLNLVPKRFDPKSDLRINPVWSEHLVPAADLFFEYVGDYDPSASESGTRGRRGPGA